MTTKHPRLNVTLDKQHLGIIATLADKNNQSLSNTAKDLIIKALEMEEDIYLSAIAIERDKDNTQWLDEDAAWE